MKSKFFQIPGVDERDPPLTVARNLKMARSAHAYVRGNTIQFYEWLDGLDVGALPEGPAIWICGDCHVGNLGPVADANGKIEIEIRDLDQTVIGNPAHDLVRLGLSLASAARGSDLPGVTTAQMLEQMIEGYQQAFDAPDGQLTADLPQTVHFAMKQAARRSWKHLARERIADADPIIPLGKRFWPISGAEKRDIVRLVEAAPVRRLATMLRSRDDDATVQLLDAAYWMKGCSSLGLLRYCALLGVGGPSFADMEMCLMDVKEAAKAAAPRSAHADMPLDDGERVVEGARRLSPFLGQRMRAAHLLDRPIFIRELLPQDLKLEISAMSHGEAMRAARFLAAIVGKAHARQMDEGTRRGWRTELSKSRSRTLEAPSWLWSSVVDLLVSHERGYLEHCRVHSSAAGAGAAPPPRSAP
ncbi:conserved hypothetical protein [Methylocella silvestris BL2]|uniref:DUF2252 domain-containing protein n=1 Tax=Methylocella silvestris (strain DSM 15510 / CIP 108128 / LMG 27833 / NCIMB 13906 / BL2) TaxID=395965 RepID=B8EIY1_METSB|nr:DUF2252 family protein [Methylocella silvestris]ACK52473.1 conserved hypothetical protein [Methylocella silvestris BL2]